MLQHRGCSSCEMFLMELASAAVRSLPERLIDVDILVRPGRPSLRLRPLSIIPTPASC